MNVVYDVLHKLSGIIAELPSNLRECLKPGAQLMRITKWSNNVLGTPDSAFLNIVDNRKQLKEDFKNLLDQIKKSDFNQAGHIAAKIMKTILGEVPASWETDVVEATPWGIEKVPLDPFGIDINAISAGPYAEYGIPYSAAYPNWNSAPVMQAAGPARDSPMFVF